MHGLDTSVLVRFVTRDDRAQAEVAKRFIDGAASQGDSLRVCTPVLCELVWVLTSDLYGYERRQVADAIEMLLDVPVFDVAVRDLVRAAVNDYRSGDADFSDYLIGYLHRQAGCESTATFDVTASESELFSLLES